mmetsp:Transcript_27248/g.89004  ORF Transcript_27248/g.89004 Transcript_27248/m.89004 type:complete len:246 (-) Transcript_27248:820-1557(-)
MASLHKICLLTLVCSATLLYQLKAYVELPSHTKGWKEIRVDDLSEDRVEDPNFGGRLLLPLTLWNMLRKRIQRRLTTIIHTCALQDWRTFDADSNVVDPGFVIWTCRRLCGGNGDRLRGLTHALYLALQAGYNLRIDWTNPVNIDTLFTNRSFALWNTVVSTRNSRSAQIDIMNTRESVLCKVKHHKVIRLATNMDPELSSCDTSQYLRGMFVGNGTSDIYDVLGDRNRMIGCTFWYLFALVRRK